MNDLVSKTEVIKRIKEQYNKHNELIPFWLSIGDIPIVKERPTAEWLKSEIPNELYVCSNCGGACWSYDYERIIVKSRFCPNCGAKMVEPREMEGKNQ